GGLLVGMLIVAVRVWPAREVRPRVPAPRVTPARSPLLRPTTEQTVWTRATRPGWRGPNATTQVLEPVPEARAVAVAEVSQPVAVAEQDGEFSEREFRAWADGKREGIAEGRALAMDELGAADGQDPDK